MTGGIHSVGDGRAGDGALTVQGPIPSESGPAMTPSPTGPEGASPPPPGPPTAVAADPAPEPPRIMWASRWMASTGASGVLYWNPQVVIDNANR